MADSSNRSMNNFFVSLCGMAKLFPHCIVMPCGLMGMSYLSFLIKGKKSTY